MWNPFAQVDEGPSALRSRRPVTLAFRPGSSLDAGLRLTVQVGGGAPFGTLIDTGSTGLVIGQKHLGRDYAPTGETFTDFTYSSSGNSYSGEWVVTRVRLFSASGAHVDTAPMRVRMVTRQHRAGEAPVTDPQAITVAMMGVGFDRHDPHGSTVDPALNPFLAVESMQEGGSTSPGYILTASDVTLGITDENLAGFELIQLEKVPVHEGDDWRAPRMRIEVPTAGVPPQRGQLLIDTGLQYAIVQVPAGIDPPQRQGTGRRSRRSVLVDGQRVVVTMPDLGGRALYDFTVGDARSGAPVDVAWGHRIAAHGNEAFVNTSLHALSQLDYAYDAGRGRVGFRFHRGAR